MQKQGKKNLHPGARWIFRFRSYSTLLPIAIFLGFFIIAASLAGSQITGFKALILILPTILLLIILIAIGETYTRMAYNRYLYEFTAHGYKSERGIIWKKYSNIPYERIQNVDIRRGILARLFGFSELIIQTAGDSHHPYMRVKRKGLFARPMAEGHLPGIHMEEAEQIRDFLLKKISRKN